MGIRKHIQPGKTEEVAVKNGNHSVSLVAIALITLAPLAAAGQTDTSDAAATPRTPWGQPDLQGVWDFRTITPMQRPEEQADTAFITAEEAAELEQRAVDREDQLWNQTAQRTEAGGNVGAYNNFWMDRGTNIARTRRTSLIVDPPNGRMPALTASGQRRAEARREYAREHPADSYLDFSAGVRCVLGFNAGPPMTPSAYNNNMQLFQTPDHIVLVTEMVHTARVVPIDGPPHLDPDVQQWSGDSRGHWEGDTLVIETRNFAAKRRWRGTTEHARLVERLTRADANTLVYTFTVTDPETWANSWTAEVPMRRNDGDMFEYTCHEGNYSMSVMLGGTRVEELETARDSR